MWYNLLWIFKTQGRNLTICARNIFKSENHQNIIICNTLHKILTNVTIFTYITWNKSKVGDCSRGWLEGSLFNSYYTKILGRAQILSLDCSTLPLIRTLYCWVLSKDVSSTIFKVFGMTQPGNWTQISWTIGKHSTH